jgi:hypothetical protein
MPARMSASEEGNADIAESIGVSGSEYMPWLEFLDFSSLHRATQVSLRLKIAGLRRRQRREFAAVGFDVE